LSEFDTITIQVSALIYIIIVFKGGLYGGEQRTEKSAKGTTQIKQTKKRDAEGEKGR
jgi:hypothetical protein